MSQKSYQGNAWWRSLATEQLFCVFNLKINQFTIAKFAKIYKNQLRIPNSIHFFFFSLAPLPDLDPSRTLPVYTMGSGQHPLCCDQGTSAELILVFIHQKRLPRPFIILCWISTYYSLVSFKTTRAW